MPRFFNRHYILIITTLTSFMTPFMAASINIALPSIGREFSLNAILLSWVATSFLLTTAVLLIPAGRLSDIFGRAKYFRYGIVIYTIGSLTSGLAFSGYSLILFRVFQAAGAAMIFSTAMAILVSSYKPGERGWVLGINTAAVYTGLSTGPFLGGIITQHLGWRFIFYINTAIGVLVAFMIFRNFIADENQTNTKYDSKGAIGYVISMLMVLYGFTKSAELTGLLLMPAGIAGLILLMKYESRIHFPLIEFGIFKENRTFLFSNLAALINYSATFAIGFLLSFYLQFIKQLSPQDAGIILVTQPIMQALFSPVAGRLSDKIEPQVVASAGMGIITAGLVILTFLTNDTPMGFLLFSLILLGFGFALFSSPNTNAVMSSVEKSRYGVASSTISSMRMIGQMFSMGIVMIIFALFIGQVQITSAYSAQLLTSIRTAFIIFSLLCAGGVFASLARGKIHSSGAQKPQE